MTTEDAIKELELQSKRFRFAINRCAVPEVGCPELLRCCEAMELSVSALRAQRGAIRPLSWQELAGMGGEPVWMVARPDWGRWELHDNAEGYFLNTQVRDRSFYGMKCTECAVCDDHCGRHGLHRLGWLAFRQKPPKGVLVK